MLHNTFGGFAQTRWESVCLPRSRSGGLRLSGMEGREGRREETERQGKGITSKVRGSRIKTGHSLHGDSSGCSTANCPTCSVIHTKFDCVVYRYLVDTSLILCLQLFDMIRYDAMSYFNMRRRKADVGPISPPHGTTDTIKQQLKSE